MPGAPRGRHAERVADLDVAQAPELADLPGADLLAPDRRAALEDADRGDLPLRVAAVPAGRQRGAVSLPGSGSRSRTCSAPENIRTYAIFSPAGPRSTLNTVPETGPAASPWVAGRNRVSPAVSSATPAPVIAEPKNTGCTRPRLAWAASARLSRR